MRAVILDFETRSRIDLTREGTAIYARDKSTQVLCLGYWTDPTEEESKVYIKPWPAPGYRGHFMPKRLKEAISHKDTVLVAHNALFERAIWTHVLKWPEIPAERWVCTSNLAGLYNLPDTLGDLTAYLWPKDVDRQKDKRGKQLIQLLSKPHSRTGEFNEDSGLMQEMYQYCAQDVRVTGAVWKLLPASPPGERRIQIADVHANETGYQVDREFCKKAVEIDSRMQTVVVEECEKLTGLRPTQTAKLKTWLGERGCEMPDMSRQTIEQKLAGGEQYSELVRKVMELRVAGARGSTQKFEQLLVRSTDAFPRITHHTKYASGNTARWIAKGAQIHNFRSRNLISYDLPGIKREVLTGTLPKNVDIRNYIGGAVRAAIVATPGKLLALGDYSGMENRMLMYLSGEERQLQLIRDGLDVYRDLATRVFGIPNPDDIDPWQRQICKHMVLGLGFGMGAYTFFTNLKFHFQVDLTYGICRAIVGPDIDRLTDDYIQRLKDSEKLRNHVRQQVCLDGGPLTRKVMWGLVTTTHLVNLFRADFNTMSSWWKTLDGAFKDLLESAPGTSIAVPPACIMHRRKTAIVFELPSGRPMYYWNPRYRKGRDPVNDRETTQLVYHQATGGTMKLLHGYGARYGANLVQGYSRDIMGYAFADLYESQTWDPIVTVHDEVISEVDDRYGDSIASDYEGHIMDSAMARSWSRDIPLKVDADISPCWLSKG